MRFVICSKTNPDVIGNLNSLIDQYRLTKVTTTVESRAIGRVLCMSKPLWQYPSPEEDIVAYTNSIIEIVEMILNMGNDDTEYDTQNKVIDKTTKENLNEYQEERPKKRKSFFGKKEEDEVSDLGIEDVDYTVDESTGRKYKLYPEINKNKKEDEE